MIVECPGCHSRYDVTGRPAGTQARCRCGTSFTLPAPSGQAGMLACPRCGGSVAATNHDCEFCAAALQVKACPRCFARMFVGARHCDQCGASVIAPASADLDGNASRRKCPRCLDPDLDARLIGDVLLDECARCRGVFVDVAALERILTERHQERAETILGALGDSVAPEIGNAYVGRYRMLPQPEGPVYVKCPDCEKLMARRQFAAGAGVIVDVCRGHGTWFDADELPQVIDFAIRGGLERARRRAEEEERERLRQEKARSKPVSPGDSPWALRELPSRDVGLGGLLGSLLGALGKLLADR